MYVQNIRLLCSQRNLVFQGVQGIRNLPTDEINVGLQYWNTHTQIRRKSY